MSRFPTEAELNRVTEWVWAASHGGRPLLSFEYDGQPSDSLVQKWTAASTTDGERVTATLTDPATGLQVRIEGTGYNELPGGRVGGVPEEHGHSRYPDHRRHLGARRHLLRREGGRVHAPPRRAAACANSTTSSR